MEITKISDIDQIESIIGKATVCRVGLVDGDEPYVVPVCFGYERGALYFHGALKGRKVDLIQRNNKTCFEMEADVKLLRGEDACEWAMKYRSVIGVGKARILETDEEKSHGLNVIMKQYAKGDFSFSKSKLDEVLVVKVDISRMSGKQLQD